MIDTIASLALSSVLAFTLVEPPKPPPSPPTIPPEVAPYVKEPLRMPGPDEDPVASGLLPADVNAAAEEEQRLMDEGAAKLRAATAARLARTGLAPNPVTDPPKSWSSVDVDVPTNPLPDMTQTKPPEKCLPEKKRLRYVDAGLSFLCECDGKRWCPVGPHPCTGTSDSCAQ